MSRPLRVRAVHTRYPHWGAHSGIHQFVRYVDPARARVSLHGSSDGDADFPIRHAGVRAWLRRRCVEGRPGWYGLSDLAAEASAFAGAAARRIDVVHLLDGEHGLRYLAPALRRASFARTGVIATFHQPPSLLHEVVDRAALADVDRVAVVAPTQVEYFAQFLPADRIEVVLHGIDAEYFRPAPAADPRESFRCISVGHWLRDWAAIRAVALDLRDDPRVAFDVVTNRPTGLEDLSNVAIHRDVSDDRLLALYQNADALLLPLHDATANNAVLEAIACGLPVITSDLPSLHAYLPGGEAIFVKNNQVDDLAAAVRVLQEDLDLRATMGRRARRRAETLAWPRVAQAWQEIYTAVVAGRRR